MFNTHFWLFMTGHTSDYNVQVKKCFVVRFCKLLLDYDIHRYSL